MDSDDYDEYNQDQNENNEDKDFGFGQAVTFGKKIGRAHV